MSQHAFCNGMPQNKVKIGANPFSEIYISIQPNILSYWYRVSDYRAVLDQREFIQTTVF